MKKQYLFIGLFAVLSLLSCEKEIKVDIKGYEDQLVVEAYINDQYPALNYVILSKNFSFQNPNFAIQPILDAQVQIFEGNIGTNNDTTWINPYTPIPLSLDSLGGIYLDPTQQLKGKQNGIYKLQINWNGKTYQSITRIPEAVLVDSLTYEHVFEDNDTFSRMTVHFMEPEKRGNCYRAVFKRGSNRNLLLPDSLPVLWGAFEDRYDNLFNDEIINGIYRRFTYGNQLARRDTIHYYFMQMDRPVYDFWLSFSNAKNNGGPFATPIVLKSNISGGAIGCFTGYSVNYNYLLIQK